MLQKWTTHKHGGKSLKRYHVRITYRGKPVTWLATIKFVHPSDDRYYSMQPVFASDAIHNWDWVRVDNIKGA